ncbi:fructose bisphosphate aldolase [Cognatishimia sp. MH4019]|uniref:fructose bisphosphate aldolase n=1 Tax=Cognatishimia sp. MH4019 TaxID=2854030 RepID=UPI001CD569AA|nr:fructose bisphosphate aldolase [Cognatishimia sp. MH4019]
MSTDTQRAKIVAGQGFIAALDQSGGSTPKALKLYGVEESEYGSDAEMFEKIHDMRTRIVNAPAFSGDKVIGAILFENTMDREIGGKPSSLALWEDNGVVPFLKVDKGLQDSANGVKLMKPIEGLDPLLERAKGLGVFGTKMRSVIDAADKEGISKIVAQQFEVGRQILSHGLMPILEPEVTITIDDKAEAEAMLLDAIANQLAGLPDDEQIMLKLSLPTQANFYKTLVEDPKVLKVVALSGGYSRAEANDMLAQNAGMIASFSRALTEGLSAQQSDAEFNSMIADTIDSIHRASVAG